MAEKLFIGFDVGGTKIAAALVAAEGKILSRHKVPTPQNAKPQDILETILVVLKEIAQTNNIKISEVAGIGLGVPGIVDQENNILATPNINLAGFPLARELKEKFSTRIAINNDVNLGLLGEQWLGAGKGKQNIIGIFPGTGIGGGIIINGQLYTGAYGAAAEIGHMIVAINGPKCSCGNRGCLEALASRWAIERDIRDASKKDKKTVISELAGGDLSRIKSKVIKEALKKKDPVIVEIMDRVAEVLGQACISLKHLLNPELIIFGGGVIEACGDYILPIVEKTVDSDPFFSKKIDKCSIVESKLGDDAIMLGAVAYVQGPLTSGPAGPLYPNVQLNGTDGVKVDNIVYKRDFFIRADGKIKLRKVSTTADNKTEIHKLSADELEKICKKNPELLIIGSGKKECLELAKDAEEFLKSKHIELAIHSTDKAIGAYNESERRKALLIHQAC